MKTVKVEPDTHRALTELKRPGDDYDAVISRYLPDKDLGELAEVEA